ncbi:tryptophan synthase beta subunit-like PLP-dependent enzyme [Aspergillus filifer]
MAPTPLTIQTAAAAIEARDRLKPHLLSIPLVPSRNDPNLLFKSENFQKTSSLKIRGAMNRMLLSSPETKLITASSRNHGIGASCAAKTLKAETDGRASGDSEKYAQALAADPTGGYTYVSPFNDPDIVAGQGTIVLEILERSDRVDNTFIAMGGGGLISGIGAVIYGVAATNSKALAESIAADKVVDVEHRATLADAVAGGIDDDTITLPLAMDVVDEVVERREEEIKDALRRLAWEGNMIVEGSAALALAGFRKVAPSLEGQCQCQISDVNPEEDSREWDAVLGVSEGDVGANGLF